MQFNINKSAKQAAGSFSDQELILVGLTTPYHTQSKRQSEFLPFLDTYLEAKNQDGFLIPSQGINDQKPYNIPGQEHF